MSDNKQDKKPINNYVKYSGMVFQMAVVIGLGTLLGIWADGKFPNKYSAYTIAGALLGVFTSMYIVFKQLKDTSNE